MVSFTFAFHNRIQGSIDECNLLNLFGPVDGKLLTEGSLVLCREVFEVSLERGVNGLIWLEMSDNELTSRSAGSAPLFVEAEASRERAYQDENSANNEECLRNGDH